MKVKRFEEIISENSSSDIINNVEITKGFSDKDVNTLLQGLTVSTWKRKVNDLKPVHITGVIGVKDDARESHRLEVTMSNRDKIYINYTAQKDKARIHLAINDDDVIFRERPIENEYDYPFSSFIEAVVKAYRAHLGYNSHRVIESQQSAPMDLFKIDDDSVEKLKANEWEIEKIVSITSEPNEITEAALQTDMEVKDVKRGDILWITAYLKPKSKSVAYNGGTLGVLKVRVVDLYYNLAVLKNKGK